MIHVPTQERGNKDNPLDDFANNDKRNLVPRLRLGTTV